MPAISVAAPAGTCVYLGGAFVFVKGSDNNLWCAWPSGGYDTRWAKLGSSVAQAMGTLTTSDFIFSFVQGTNGELYCYWTDGTSWKTVPLGLPKPGVGIAGSVGVWATRQFVYVFVRGTDGHLWTRWFDGGDWAWLDLGTPPGLTVAAAVGVTTTPGPNGPVLYAMVQGSDGKLWTSWWDGRQWAWACLSEKFATPVGVTFTGRFLYVFLKGLDGALWCLWLNGANWVTVSLGLPDGVQIAEGIGAQSFLGNPVALVRGSDGRLWAKVWSANQWNWANLGHPHFASVAGGIGVSRLVRGGGGLSQEDQALAVLGLGIGAGKIFFGAKDLYAASKATPSEPLPPTNPSAREGGIAGIAGGINTIAQSANTLSKAGSSEVNIIYTFVQGTDGHVWVNSIDGTSASWTDFGSIDWN